MKERFRQFGAFFGSVAGKASPVIWGGMAVLIIGVLAHRAWGAYEQNREFVQHLRNLDLQIESVEQEIQGLQQEEQALKRDPEHIERLLRDELHWRRPGEITVRPVFND
jgi:hypothetical protein